MIQTVPIPVTEANLVSNVPATGDAWSAGTYDTGVQRVVDNFVYEVIASPNTDDEPTAGVAADPPTWKRIAPIVPEWTAGSYNKGQQVSVGTEVYEVTATTSTTDEPTAGVAEGSWIRVGSINRLSMFDFTIGRKTTRASPIVVEVTPGRIANALALFQIEGAAVRVEVDDPVEGVLYDRTIQLVDNSAVQSVYDFFFAPYDVATDAVFMDLPNLPGAAVRITITGPGDVSVGEVVLGQQQRLGITSRDVSLSIEDFSIKNEDGFGNVDIDERPYTDVVSFKVYVKAAQQKLVKRRLAEQRAKPAFYAAAENRPETHVLGFLNNLVITRTTPIEAEMRIEVESIV